MINVPGMVSFAGGLPDESSFPSMNLDGVPTSWLQYGATEGEPALRQKVAEELGASGLSCSPDQVLVLSGSQQGIDLVAKLFVDVGTPVAVESPTYLAALQVLRLFGADLLPFELSPDGLRQCTALTPVLLYAIPTFQNPTGHCYSAAERDLLARECDAGNIVLFEDDPYRDLAYENCERTPVCARLKRASWIYQGSFSKSLAPGLRLGFLAASSDLIGPLAHLKQAADLHSSRISQWLVLEALQGDARQEQLRKLTQVYREKRDRFATALQRHLGGLASWNAPPGGLFFWIRLHRQVNTRALLAESIRRGVAFMPGEPFFADGRTECGSLRLNFTHASADQVERGLSTLAGLLSQPG